MNYKFQLYRSVSELPENWDQIVASRNILLSKAYFHVLESSKPKNMMCFFGGFFSGEELIGGCLFQYLDFTKHHVLQTKDLKCSIRNFISKIFIKNVLIVGNNMLTGQNAFYFNPEKISIKESLFLLAESITEIQKKIKKASLITIKDFTEKEITNFEQDLFQSYFRFSVQPNMILKIKNHWLSFENYTEDFTKKYQKRIISARKKSPEIQKCELQLEKIKENSSALNSLYQIVAENATINTFFLPEHHFAVLKENLGGNFKVFGYFLNGNLIGFYTLILNGETVDTYFLGYEKSLQKEKQLYLNMLLDMAEFAIREKFKKIAFGRTALEIKSTIGAEPEEIFGLIKHKNPVINHFMNRIFPSIEPKTEWLQRNPFK